MGCPSKSALLNGKPSSRSGRPQPFGRLVLSHGQAGANQTLERVGEMTDDGPAGAVEFDGQDVEAAGDGFETVFDEVSQGDAADLAALGRRDGGLGDAEIVVRAGFDLGENKRFAVPGDDVDFAAMPPIAPDDYPEFLLFEIADGRVLAVPPQPDPVPVLMVHRRPSLEKTLRTGRLSQRSRFRVSTGRGWSLSGGSPLARIFSPLKAGPRSEISSPGSFPETMASAGP